MLTPCEVAVKCVLPAVRAMIAKELMTKHKLKQLDVANLLGVSQSAISLYYRKIRGKAINLEEEEDVTALVNDMAGSMAEDKMMYEDFVMKICDVCRIVRSKGLMCELHKNLDPNVEIEECEFCSIVMRKC